MSWATLQEHGQYLRDRVRNAAYEQALEALAPGKTVLDLGAGTGLLARAVQAAHPGTALTLLDDAYAAWHERAAAALGATAEQWAGARERMHADRLAPLDDQLAWLRAAGFADVDCLFKDHCFAVLVARR